MRGAAVFQVAPQRNGHAFEFPAFFFQGVKIAQGLRGVLVSAVAGVNHRYRGVIGHQLRGAFPGVAQHDDIGVRADNPGHVRDAFTLGE